MSSVAVLNSDLGRGCLTVLMAIAVGGALGSLSRYFLATKVYGWLGIAFPYGTLVVNLVGCFLLGMVVALVENRGLFGPALRSFLTVGFLGGLTTFSTFVYETWGLVDSGDLLRPVLYLAVSCIGGLLCLTLGMILTRVVVQ